MTVYENRTYKCDRCGVTVVVSLDSDAPMHWRRLDIRPLRQGSTVADDHKDLCGTCVGDLWDFMHTAPERAFAGG